MRVAEFNYFDVVPERKDFYLDEGKKLYSTIFESIQRALEGMYISAGLSATSNDNMTVTIDAGTISIYSKKVEIDSKIFTHSTSLTDRNRMDVICYNAKTGSLELIEGLRWFSYNETYIEMTERLYEYQIPIALVKVRANATSIVQTDVYDVRAFANTVNLNSTADIIPQTDNQYVVGLPTNRFKELHVVNAYIGDLIFDNKYALSEYDKDGKLFNGIRLVDEKGQEIVKITKLRIQCVLALLLIQTITLFALLGGKLL